MGRPNEEDRGNQTPGDRRLLILAYLKKKGREWSNPRQIATGVLGSDLNRKRLESDLDELVQRGLITKNTGPLSNPQAKSEYQISEKGIIKFKQFLMFLNDPDMKSMSGLKQKEFE